MHADLPATRDRSPLECVAWTGQPGRDRQIARFASTRRLPIIMRRVKRELTRYPGPCRGCCASHIVRGEARPHEDGLEFLQQSGITGGEDSNQCAQLPLGRERARLQIRHVDWLRREGDRLRGSGSSASIGHRLARAQRLPGGLAQQGGQFGMDS
jgi:hypothetical protein